LSPETIPSTPTPVTESTEQPEARVVQQYDPTPWYAKISLNGKTFRSAQEYTDYMSENKLWGTHPTHTMTQEEWEAIKAKKLAETGEVLGTVKFVAKDDPTSVGKPEEATPEPEKKDETKVD